MVFLCYSVRCLYVILFGFAVFVPSLRPPKEPCTDSPWKHQILKASWVSYLIPSSWVLRGVFFWWEKFLKGFDTGQSDIRSGTSMTTWCVVNANILYTLIQLDSSKHRLWAGAISRLSKGRKIYVSSCNIGYPDPQSPCWPLPCIM